MVTTINELEQQLVEALNRMGYTTVTPEADIEGTRSLRATRDTELGQDHIYIATDFWRKTEVDQSDVEQIIGRMLREPRSTRIVIVTTGRYSESAKSAARTNGVALLASEQLTTLLQRAAKGDSPTAAISAAQAAPATAPRTVAAPAVGNKMFEGAREKRRSRLAEPAKQSRRTDGIVPFFLLFLVTALIVTLVVINIQDEEAEGTTPPRASANAALEVRQAGNNTRIIQLQGSTDPNTEVALFRNDAFVERIRTDGEGRFNFDFVPLEEGRNTLRVVTVNANNLPGNVVWEQSISPPFFNPTPTPAPPPTS